MTILDTNLIIRHVTQDSLDQSSRARPVFTQLEAGRRSVRLPEGVLVEAVQVLDSRKLYDVPRIAIRTELSALIRMPGIQVSSKQLYLRALDIYVDYPRLSFVDALCVAYAERESEPTVLTFDRGFDRVVGLTREEP